MITLKQVIHYTDTNSVEATWVDRIQLPDTEVPESFGPTTRGEDGSIIPGELIPAHVVKGGVQDTVIKCHSYADVQMQMLRDDAKEFGTPLGEYEALIELIESNIKPPEPISPAVLKAGIFAQLLAIDAKSLRPLRDGDTVFLSKLAEQAKALRAELSTL